jgi:hypothetical protein
MSTKIFVDLFLEAHFRWDERGDEMCPSERREEKRREEKRETCQSQRHRDTETHGDSSGARPHETPCAFVLGRPSDSVRLRAFVSL